MSAESDFRRAADRYRKAQAHLAERRRELEQAAATAYAAGMTYAAMAEILGVSRQRVMDILKRS